MKIKNKKTRDPARMTLTLLPRNRSGLSEVIGYVLLIAVSIAISILVYQFLKTYVPTEALACPDGTSIFIKSYTYDTQNGILKITLQNNGKFGIAGFFIHASTSASQLATIDLSNNLTLSGTCTLSSKTCSYTSNCPGGCPSSSTCSNGKCVKGSIVTCTNDSDCANGGNNNGNSVVYVSGSTSNGFDPGSTKASTFDVYKILFSGITLSKIEIIPTRYQLQDNFWKFVSCSNAKVEQAISQTTT